MGRFVPTALLALALIATACAREDVPEPPNGGVPADTTGGAAPDDGTTANGGEAADPAMEQTSECVNPTKGYAVLYPADWQVNTSDVVGPCTLFDPEPIEVPRGSEIPIDIAVMIDVEPVPIATLSGDVRGRRNLSRERTTVDGREAVRIEGESTGEGLYDRGQRSYQYFVDLGDSTMVAATYDAGSVPFERKRRILDAMMEMFDFRSSADAER